MAEAVLASADDDRPGANDDAEVGGTGTGSRLGNHSEQHQPEPAKRLRDTVEV